LEKLPKWLTKDPKSLTKHPRRLTKLSNGLTKDPRRLTKGSNDVSPFVGFYFLLKMWLTKFVIQKVKRNRSLESFVNHLERTKKRFAATKRRVFHASVLLRCFGISVLQ